MFFKKGKFFLDLGGDSAEATPVQVAPVRQAAPSISVAANPAPGAAAPAAPAAAAPAASAAEAPAAGPNVTTAEAIAAELAAAAAARPAPTLATFAPEFVTAGGAVPSRRRRAGANLAGFKEMAQGMMKS